MGILLSCFPLLGHRSECRSIYSSESSKTPLISIDTGQGDSSHSGGESDSSILCSNCSTCRAWLSVFCIDFSPSSFLSAFGWSSLLSRKLKTLQGKAAASSTDGSFSQGNSGISALRMETPRGSFQKYYLLMHSCAFWCLSRGKMSNNKQNSCLLLVVL